MQKSKNSSLRAQWLGERLKKARNAAGFTLREAAEYLQLHEGTMSRFETATYPVRRSYIKDLIDFYGVSEPREREALLQLCEDAWRKDWWDGQASDVEREFVDYTWLEARAKRICAFEPMLIHGLLQIRPYANAVIRFIDHENASDAQVDRLTDFRMRRQETLHNTAPTHLTAILEQVTLQRPIGGTPVMQNQLKHLMELNSISHIEVLILPTSTGLHRGTSGPFTYFEMPDPYSNVAFVDNLAGRTYLEEEGKVARFSQAYDDLRKSALNKAESTKLIKKALKDLE